MFEPRLAPASIILPQARRASTLRRVHALKPHRAKPHPESLVVGALLTALVALGQISTSIYIPSLPSLVTALHTAPEHVNLTLSGFLFGFAVCQLVYGPLSDRFGRRPVLLVGIGLYLAASIVCVFAGTIDVLIVGRVLQGMSACSGPVLGRAIIRDIYGAERSAKAMAYVGMALAVSPALAPIIGGYLQDGFGWQAPFVFLAAFGAIILVAVAGLLEETAPSRDREAMNVKSLTRAYMALLASPVYHGYVLLVACVFAGLMAFTAAAPFVFIDVIGLTPAQFGMLAVFNVAGFFSGSLAAARLGPVYGIDRLLLVGSSLCVVGGAAMLGLGLGGAMTIAAIIAPMMVFTLGMGIVFPNGIAGAMIPFPGMAGAASAGLGFVQMMVAGAASVVVGVMPHTSQVPMAAVIAGASAAGSVAFIVLVWRRRPARR